jgi:hypothetical protein
MSKLYLHSNALTGSLPSELGLLTALTDLRLGENHLMGSLPTQLGGLSSLERFNLSHNSFTGTIPTEVVLLANASLERMSIEGTDLTGILSEEMCSVSFWGSCPAFMDCSACLADLTSEYWDLFGSACYIEPKMVASCPILKLAFLMAETMA